MCARFDDKPRLNPFPFPSDTTLRFVILVGLAIAASGSVYADLWSAFNHGSAVAASNCQSESIAQMFRVAEAAKDLSELGEKQAHIISECSRLLGARGLWEIAGILLALGVATIIYWFLPSWKLKYQHLQNVTGSAPAEVVQMLGEFCETAAMRTLPTFVWNPVSGGMPVAFGRGNRLYVAISGGFVCRYFYNDVAAFRAIMLHELAHVRNGDINKAYFTISVWVSFVITAVLPAMVICLLVDPRPGHASATVLDVAISVALVALAGMAVLRAREYYADVRASEWDGTKLNIDRVLSGLPAIAGGAWLRYFRFHPDPDERRRIIDDTSQLFPLNRWVAAGLGLVTWMLVGAAITVSFPFLPANPQMFLLTLITVEILGPPLLLLILIGVIGVAVWRATFASLITGRSFRENQSRLAIAVGMSYLAYQLFIMFELFLTDGQLVRSTLMVQFFAGQFIVAIALVVVCLLVLRWISTAVSAWFEVSLTYRSPHTIVAVTVGVALILMAGITFSTMVIVMMAVFTTTSQSIGEWVYISGTIAFVVLLMAWVFPLIGAIQSSRVTLTKLPHWVFIDNIRRELFPQTPLRLRSSIIIGIAAGFAGSMLWLPLVLRRYLPPDVEDQIKLFLTWAHASASHIGGGFEITILTAGIQVISAVIAAAKVERLNTICGMFSASISGGIMCAVTSIIIYTAPGPNVPITDLMWSTMAFTSLGALIILPAAGISGWLHRRRIRNRTALVKPYTAITSQ